MRMTAASNRETMEAAINREGSRSKRLLSRLNRNEKKLAICQKSNDKFSEYGKTVGLSF
jgi:hypothetical protein